MFNKGDDQLVVTDVNLRRERRDDGAAQPAMPGALLITTIIFVVLATLFALATVLHLLVADGTPAVGVFFATMSLACAVTVAGLSHRRTWAAYLTYGLTGLLAAASLGLFSAITIVGAGLLVWVFWALGLRRSRDWLAAASRR